MAIAKDFVHSFWRPGTVVRGQRDRGIGEERLLAYVIFAALFTYIAKVPDLMVTQAGMVAAAPDEAPSFSAFAGINFVTSVIFAPLFMYMIAAVTHLLLRLFKAKGTWYEDRLALFWALIVTQPLVLFRGLVLYPNASQIWVDAASALIAGLFFFIWISGLKALKFSE